MSKKFELTSETKIVFGKTLYRIKALISFGDVTAGDSGGWVEKEDNLSQAGDAWVSGNAQVYGDARVSGNAWVSGNAQVYGDARVSGNAQVYGDARVYGDAQIIWVSKIGSELGTLTGFMDKDGSLVLTRGCFIGTADEFMGSVAQKHGESKIAKEYALAVELIKLRLSEAV